MRRAGGRGVAGGSLQYGSMPPSRRRPWLTIALIPIGLAVVAVLFMRSLDDTRAEPFTVRGVQLTGWTLTSNPEASPGQPRLILAPPAELPMRLFRQVFTRAGESLTTPNLPGIWLALADELRGASISEADLLGLARDAGLDRATLVPRCMAYRRESQPGSTRQLYFVWFELPELQAFRQALADRAATAGGPPFNPETLQPVMMLAAAPDFSRWMPLEPVTEKECMASVEAEGN